MAITTSTDIPECLCGTSSEVRRNWRKVCKRAVKRGSVAEAMVGEPRVPIDDTPGQIVLEKPHKLVEMEHVIVQPVIDELLESTYGPDRGAWYVKMKQLIWSCFDEFWFCLAILAADRFILPIKTPYDDVRVEDCRVLLRKIHRWWPTFCRLEDRFAGNMLDPLPGYRWGSVVWGFLRAIGHEEVIWQLQKVDAEEGGELIKEVLGS